MSGAASGPERVWFNRRGALLLNGAFWAFEMLFALAMAAVFLAELRSPPAWLIAAVLCLTALLAGAGLNYAVFCLAQLGAPGPVLAVGPDGLFDRRIAAQPIPWRAISRIVVYAARGPQVMFDVDPAAEAGFRRAPRAWARLHRALGFPGYNLITMGTDASAVDLAEALRIWRRAPGG